MAIRTSSYRAPSTELVPLNGQMALRFVVFVKVKRTPHKLLGTFSTANIILNTTLCPLPYR
jgi:hypothetical protein